MKNGIRIAISGRSGCGNSTVSKMAAEALGLKFINFTFRSLAAERNMDFLEVLELAQADDSWDIEIDTRQVKLALDSNGCVLGSRLAIWMLKEADLKVYLHASDEIRIERIIKREGGDRNAVGDFTKKRDLHDHQRYLRIYNIDTNDYSFADLIIDANTNTPAQITDMIISRASGIK